MRTKLIVGLDPKMIKSTYLAKVRGVDARDGILAENKFRISDDLFRINFGRVSISVEFRIICINFG